jgi:RecB family exonuclease
VLEHNFQFSQASLQDYEECPRRFQLRYILRLAWPAVETEPVEEQEKRMRLGVDFHTMVQRHLSSIPIDVLERNQLDEDLSMWWLNYKVFKPYDLSGKKYVEVVLSAPTAGFRLVAKFDLIIADPGKQLTIIDWKTSQSLPRKITLMQRMQSSVYPYVCALAGNHLFEGKSLLPNDIQMIYWFPAFPDAPVRFQYSDERFDADHKKITKIIQEIASTQDGDFRLTTDLNRCTFCRYRTYCDRGEKAGAVDSYDALMMDDDVDNDFDFEHIAEIEF